MKELIEIEGVTFQVYGRALLPFASPDREISISRASALTAMRQTGCVMLRYTDRFDGPQPTNFWHVINDRFVPLEERAGSRRRSIRKGLSRFQVETVGLESLLEHGYPIYAAAQARYGNRPSSPERWRAGLRAHDHHKEYWLARDAATGRPMAFSIVIIFEQACIYSTVQFDPSGFREFLSYAVFYSMDRHYLDDRNYSFVSDGERTISHDTNVQDFLIRELGFRKAYCRLNVFFSPVTGLIARAGAFALRRRLPMPAPLALLARHYTLAAVLE